MPMIAEKRATLVTTVDGTTYGPWEFKKSSGGKQTQSSIKTRRGAGQPKIVRVGLDDVENITLTYEDDGTIDLKWMWSVRRRALHTITITPADDDGNPRARDSAVYTGKMVGLTRADVDSESEDGIDMFDLEFALNSPVS